MIKLYEGGRFYNKFFNSEDGTHYVSYSETKTNATSILD